MIPQTAVAFVAFILLVVPGITFELLRQTRRPSFEQTALEELAPGSSRLLSAATMIQNRDIQIFLTLNEHKVLTTHQVQDLFFASPKRTRERLLRLHRANFIDRFTPPVESGSAPIHHVLGEFGAHLVAGELGIEVKGILRRLNRLAAMSRSQRLKHLVSVNGFFTRLQWACRLTGDIRVSDWWSEERTARDWGEIVRPDGFGRIESADRSRSFFVEVDLGTEAQPGSNES